MIRKIFAVFMLILLTPLWILLALVVGIVSIPDLIHDFYKGVVYED